VAEKRLQRARQQHAFEKAQRLAKAELAASELALKLDKRRLEQIDGQLERCTIHAPQAGIVVYARTNASRSARGAIVEAGAQVRERQPLIRISDPSHLRVRVHVNESRIARVRLGQPAKVQCDAFPAREFQGKVLHVSTIPEPTSWLNADVKDYAVLVSIDEPADGLRIGLTALVEIQSGD
jgi:multidrug resistance efflux pump